MTHFAGSKKCLVWRRHVFFVSHGACCIVACRHCVQVFVDKPSEISDDVHVVFHSLFAFGLGLAPMSLYGCDSRLCLVRITCSLAQDELDVMCDRLRLIGRLYPTK